MRIRALAIDLDGTLLGPDDEISPRNRTALSAAREAGWHVIVATARWYHLAQRAAVEPLGLHGPVIACSGAEVRRLPDGGDLMDARLPAEFCARLYELCDAQPCIAWFPVDDYVLMKLEGDVAASLQTPELRRVSSLRAAAPSAAARMALIQGRRIRQRVVDELAREWSTRVRFVLSITTGGKEILTLTATGADKGVALGVACRELGITPAEVVAFGDAENDIELFAAAGGSFAMGQASDAVKAAARGVTTSNADDGVGRAVELLLAKGEAAFAR
jgi:hypothetical protein